MKEILKLGFRLMKMEIKFLRKTGIIKTNISIISRLNGRRKMLFNLSLGKMRLQITGTQLRQGGRERELYSLYINMAL